MKAKPHSLSSRVLVLFAVASTALLTGNLFGQTPVFTNVWSLPAGTYADLPTGANNVRGTALSPITTNVLYGSTTGGTNNGNNHVTILDSSNAGAYIGQLSGSGVGGGSVNLGPVRVADDGAVYASDIAIPGATLHVYRWPSETDFDTAPTVIYTQGGVTTRYGDYMDVRGAGMDTEVLVGGNGTGFILLKPSEPTLTAWTNVTMTYPGAVNLAGHGIAFEGTNNAFFGKRSGSQTVYHFAYDLSIPSNWVTASFNLDQSGTSGLDYSEVNGVKLLSAICYSTVPVTNNIQHKAKVFQLTSPSNYVIILEEYLPQPNYANPNGIAMTDIKNGHAIFSESGNGMNFYSIGFITNTPPTIAGGAQPGGGIVVETFDFTFSVNPSGTAPLSYQWYFNSTNLIPGATGSSLPLTDLELSDSGGYSVVVTNPYGSVTSIVANLTVLPGRFSSAMTQLWTLAPGSRDYLTTDNTQRGMAYDPVTGNLVLVSRAPTNGVHLLNSANGADLGELDVSVLSSFGSGTFPINMVGVADDGVVYACNLITDATGIFAIYGWGSATPGAFGGAAYYDAPNIGRLGDTFIARGSGAGTELLAAARFGTNVALFTTADGFVYNLNTIAITNLPADAQTGGFAGLGIAWGEGNTFWAKSSGFRLRLVEYDVASLTGRVIGTWNAADDTMYPIGVDNANGLLAGIGAGELPQNLQMFDLLAPGNPELIDRELFAVSNPNGNGTGAVSFDVPGGRVFALDSNNGILAASYVPLLRHENLGGELVLTWAGPAELYRATSVVGPYTLVSGATSPYTNTIPGQVFYRLGR